MSIIFSGSTCRVAGSQNLRSVIRDDYHDCVDSFCWIQGGCIDAPDNLPARGFVVIADNSEDIWCLPKWQARGEPLVDEESIYQW